MTAPASALRSVARQLLPSDAKLRIARWACDERVGRAVGRAFADRIPSGGLRIRTDSEWVSPRTKAELFFGIYESCEIRFIRQFLRRDLDLVELGASLGVLHCHAARGLSPGARRLCVEANPRLLPLFERNLAENGIPPADWLLCRAIDYDRSRDRVRLELGPTSADSRIGAGSQAASDLEVPTATLSDLLRGRGIERFALISDIEGAEAGILLEDGEALRGCQQAIMELHDTSYGGRSYSFAELAHLAQQRHGLRLRQSHGPVYVFER